MQQRIAGLKSAIILKIIIIVLIAVTYGTALAWAESGKIDVLPYLSYLLIIVVLIIAENYLGIEKRSREFGINKDESKKALYVITIIFMLIVAVFCLFCLVLKTGYFMAFTGLFAILAVYNYRRGLAYRYRSFGVLLIALVICPLCVGGAYYIQTKEIVLLPFIASLPLSFLISAIIHGDDLKNYQRDRASGIRTLAVFMGNIDKKWAVYAQMENYIDTYIALFILIIFKTLPISAVLPVALILPLSDIYKDIKGALAERPECISGMPVSAYRFYCQFGILLILGIIFDKLLCR